MIRPFLTLLGFPEVLEKNESQKPKKKDFQKMKKNNKKKNIPYGHSGSSDTPNLLVQGNSHPFG